MELQSTEKLNRTTVRLENNDEACLFATEGLGLLTFKGMRLAFDVLQAQGRDEWPVEVTLSNDRLQRTADSLADEADYLGVVATSPRGGEYPRATENEATLRAMTSAINEHLEPSEHQVTE